MGIDGLGGAGKSSLAASLQGQLVRAGWAADIVPMDAFFMDRPGGSAGAGLKAEDQHGSGPRSSAPIGGSFDWMRLRDQVLWPFRQRRKVRYRVHDWATHKPGDWVALGQGLQVLIVEGVYSTRRELRRWYDLTVWLEVPAHVRLARGLERDGPESRDLWENRWMPEEERYRKAHEPHLRAHIVLDWVTGSRPNSQSGTNKALG